MSTENENTEQSTQPEQTTQPEGPKPFGPDDLVNAVLLIDDVCGEGVFRGWDNIQKAFNIRNRLLQFAQSWQATQQQMEADGEAEAEPKAEPTK